MKNMKKAINSVLLIACIAAIVSCTDDSLDPLQTKKVKKGTILALRGEQLDNIYNGGIPGAEFFPRIMDGTETFDFDAEYLAEDPNTLASFDIYVIKADGSRVLLKNVPFSEFKTTSDYTRPWVSVSLKLTDILKAIGVDYTKPTSAQYLLDNYQPGINLESDLNLTDGSKIPASDIVALGLFQSDQFYPAQKLTYNVTEFCAYQASTWGGSYKATANSDDFPPPYTVSLTPNGDNKFILTNFLNAGFNVNIEFSPATKNPSEQEVTVPKQTVNGKELTGTGTYDQCTNSVVIDISYDKKTWSLELAKN